MKDGKNAAVWSIGYVLLMLRCLSYDEKVIDAIDRESSDEREWKSLRRILEKTMEDKLFLS